MQSGSKISRIGTLRAVDRICDEFEKAWSSDTRPNLAGFLGQLPPELRSEGCTELFTLDIAYRRQSGEVPCLSDYSAEFPEHAASISQALKLAAGSPLLQQDRTAPGLAADACPVPSLPVIPGLTILRRLGVGGMGVVYEACQAGLNRHVAIKMLRAGIDATTEELARFRIEAESAARLGHPNIVQIFQIGAHHGQPFLVLEYVTGGSLREWIQHRRHSSQFSAGLVRILAAAVGHAHDRGIVHRDLKPANILIEIAESHPADDKTLHLTPAGGHQIVRDNATMIPWVDAPPIQINAGTGSCETLPMNAGPGTDTPRPESHARFRPTWIQPKIADFGLARRLDDNCSVNTLQGAILGTPSYLSPEQAAGRQEEIGAASDVYSLGVILYELLTGVQPFQASTPSATLQRVLSEEPLPPRRIEPGISRDLETICLKCLSRDPARRYPTAAALADDLNRFLHHQPIVARRAHALERLRMWCRREQRLAALVCVMLIILPLGAALFGWMWVSRQNLLSAQYQSDLADITRELSFIDREEFQFVSQVDTVRREHLSDLAARCVVLLDRGQNTPSLGRQVAEVYLRLGAVSEMSGQFESAEDAYRRALTHYSKSVFGPEALNLIARTRLKLALLLQRVGKIPEAEALLLQSVGLQGAPGLSDDGVASHAAVIQAYGTLQIRTSRFEPGERSLREALAIQKDLLTRHPTLAEHRLACAATELSLAEVLGQISQLDESQQHANSAISTIESLRGESDSPGRQFALGRALAVRGVVLDLAGKHPAGDADLVAAYVLFRDLATAHPLRPDYQIEAALARHHVSRYTGQIPGEPEPAPLAHEDRYREALALQREQVREFPLLHEARRNLAITMNSLATWLCDKSGYATDDPRLSASSLAEAERLHAESEAIWTELTTKYPDVWQYKVDLARCHQRYGIALERLNKLDAAEAGYRKSIEIQTQLSQQHPQIARHQLALAGLKCNLAVICIRKGDISAAEAFNRQAIEAAVAARKINPWHRTGRILHSEVIEGLIEQLLQSGKPLEALPLMDEAHDLFPPNAWWAYPRMLTRRQKFAECIAADPTMTPPQKEDALRKNEQGTLTWVRQFTTNVTWEPQSLPAFLKSEPTLQHVRHVPEFQQIVETTTAQLGRPQSPP